MELSAHNLHLWQRQFLDERREGTPRSVLDVAAHLLFYLTEPDMLHRLALEHLLTYFGADRADLEFSAVWDEYYAPHVDLRASADIPSVQRVPFPNRDPGVQAAWHSPQGLTLDVLYDPRVKDMRPFMLEVLGMRAKLVHRLEHGGQVFGLVCIDQVEGRRHWQDQEQAYLHQFLEKVLSPVLAASLSLQHASTRQTVSLTRAERELLALLESGLTSKEIARRLGKSPNTVDNQFSTLRQKFGARNKVELLAAWGRLRILS